MTRSELAELTAEQLGARSQGGCRASFAELVRRYDARVYNFLLRRVRNSSDAEDLTQEAFVRSWERIASYDPTRRFSTWLFTIALRLAITRHRRSRTRSTASLGDVDPQAPAQSRVNAMAEAEAAGGTSRVWAIAAGALKEEQYTALWLRYVEDMNIGEIAAVLGKSEVGVRVCLFRARQALASLIQRDQPAMDEAREAGAILNSSLSHPLTNTGGVG